MADADLLTRPVHELAALVRDGELAARELVQLSLERITELDAQLNAFVDVYDDALQEAEAIRPGDARPFAGVPIAIKNNRPVAGRRITIGAELMGDFVAPYDHNVVARLKRAGFVVVGSTTLPEWGILPVSEARRFGPTRNPWDLERTPGGSSGGSGAAVAAGMVPIAHGNDGGGSTRIPAACCGLVGLKAGRGLVPFGPDESELLHGLVSTGVVSRSVRDTAAMLDVLAGDDAVSAYAGAGPEGPLLAALEEPPGRLRVGFTTHSAIRTTPHPEAVRAVEHAAQVLTDLGHEVEEVPPPHDDAQLARDFLTIWFAHQTNELERIKARTGKGDDAFEQDTRVMAALGRAITGLELDAALEPRRFEHIAGLARLHETHDLLLTPTLGEPPIEIGALALPKPLQLVTEVLLRTRTTKAMQLAGVVDQVVQRNLAWVPYTQLANVTGRPAISLPLHWTPAGLPMGVQFVGPLRSEALLLRLARQLEQAVPWAGRRPAVS